MIEVTDEMLKVARSMQSFELMIKRIIELHEANKPKPEPVAYRWWNQGCNCDECDQYFYSEDPDFISKNREPLYTTPPTREVYTGERIVCAALKDHGDNIYHGYHHEQIYFDCDLEGKAGVIEGFVTTKNGRFVDREEAWLVAEKANQIIHRNVGVLGSLFCENIY